MFDDINGWDKVKQMSRIAVGAHERLAFAAIAWKIYSAFA